MKCIKCITRNYDVVTHTNDLEALFCFTNFPVYMGVTDEPYESDMAADMQWMISRGSGMIQLAQLVPDRILYQRSHNAGLGKVWEEHYKCFSRFIEKHAGNYDRILEIGGGNGILCKVFHENIAQDAKQWIIVEPSNVEIIPGCKAEYIHDFWGEKFILPEEIKYDILIHSHVFEHVMNLDEFMETNSRYVKNGQKMLFSLPNLKETLKRYYTNALNFEHTFYISNDYVEYFLKKYKFRIIAKELFREEHSLFYCVEKDEKMDDCVNLDGERLYQLNKQVFQDYLVFHKKLIDCFNKRMIETEKPVYLFGAHIFSQYLISFGLNTDKIVCVLDNDKQKRGKRLYGTNLYVASPKILCEEEKPVVILRVASYADEIKRDILENINEFTEFWE